MTERRDLVQYVPHPLLWTPGKWHVEHLDGGAFGIFDEKGFLFAVMPKGHNAAIMAAAPELYAILREILDNAVVNYVYREKAEKIMAKARGEEE